MTIKALTLSAKQQSVLDYTRSGLLATRFDRFEAIRTLGKGVVNGPKTRKAKSIIYYIFKYFWICRMVKGSSPLSGPDSVGEAVRRIFFRLVLQSRCTVDFRIFSVGALEKKYQIVSVE